MTASDSADEHRPDLRPILRPYDLGVETMWTRLRRWGLLAALGVGMIFYGFYYAITTPWMIVQFSLPLGAMLLIVIWILPETRTAPTRTMERLYFSYFAVLFIWPNYLAFAFSGLPWITLIRLTGFPMVLTLLISLSVSKSFRSRMLEVMNGAPFLWRMVAIFAVMMACSIVLSKAPMRSVQKVIVGEVNWIAVFFVSLYIFSKRGRVERWAYVLVTAVATISLVGIFETRHSQIPWAGHVPSFLKVDPLVANILAGSHRGATGEYRTKGTFTNALGLAEFLALSMPFVLHVAVGSFPRIAKVGAIITIPMAFYVIEATGSRLGMVGSGVGLLLYTLHWSYKRWRSFKMGLTGPALLFAYPVLALAVIALSFTYSPLRQRVWGGGATAASDAGRKMQVEVGLRKIAHNPIGHGMGMAAETLGIRGSNDKLTIDNYYVSMGLEYGVVGFFIFYGMIATAIVYAYRGVIKDSTSREFSFIGPCGISLISFFIIKWVFAQADNHPLVYMMMGAITALLWRYGGRTRSGAINYGLH